MIRYLLPFLFFGLFACDSGTPESLPDVPATENAAPDRGSAPADPQAALAGELEGDWAQEGYPNGRLTFRGDQVRFVDGEGEIGDPDFEDYQLTTSCPYERATAGADYQTFLVLPRGERCEGVAYDKDAGRLTLFNPVSGGSLVYERADTESED